MRGLRSQPPRPECRGFYYRWCRNRRGPDLGNQPDGRLLVAAHECRAVGRSCLPPAGRPGDRARGSRHARTQPRGPAGRGAVSDRPPAQSRRHPPISLVRRVRRPGSSSWSSPCWCGRRPGPRPRPRRPPALWLIDRSRCHPVLAGSAAASRTRMSRAAWWAVRAAARSPGATATSPSLSWLIDRSRCHCVLAGL
jgi:hypothetical protein